MHAADATQKVLKSISERTKKSTLCFLILYFPETDVLWTISNVFQFSLVSTAYSEAFCRVLG